MKKLFFILICIFLSFNVSAFDLFGQWVATFEAVEGDKTIEKIVEVEFLEDKCIFHYEDGNTAEYTYELDDEFLFIEGAGYWFEEIDDNTFKLVPAFEGMADEIIFERV
ncbi:MAG: hypothetical protein ACOCQD_02065 [archaeon]